MKVNRQDLTKKMTELSKELGIIPKKKNMLGKTMLWATGGVAGYFLVRELYNNHIK